MPLNLAIRYPKVNLDATLPSSTRRNAATPDKSNERPPLSPRSTLTEVLRLNQLRSKNSSSTSLSVKKKEDPVLSLNTDLVILADVFPDVKIDLLREILRRFDGDSRLQICTEQLYRYKSEWTNGRLQAPPRDSDDVILLEEKFRTNEYRAACARILSKEFSSLNKSALDAVLAEVNDSYTKARPVLQEITNKSWRATLQALFRRRKEPDVIPPFLLERGRAGYKLGSTGNEELDTELEGLFVVPSAREQVAVQILEDRRLALEINEKQAVEAHALYECQICYSDVPFENITACTHASHVICLDCVRRSLNEAVFGQNWAQSVNPQLGTLKCLAPVSEPCEGTIPSHHLQRAVLNERSGAELWTKFEDRLAEKALFSSQLPLTRCPFCPYAEVSAIYDTKSARSINWTYRPIPVTHKIVAILVCEFLLPTLLCIYILLRVLAPSYLTNLFYTSITRIAQSQSTTRFKCQHPDCHRASCTKCQKPHHNPHTCHEPLLFSLRQSVEAARTNAVKRVCPRCGTAFVKSSGCNKLTCVCGYSMCYLCRKNIGKTGENEGAEGYRHFCEHFRPVPGQKCTQCEKCDLYKNEDEDIMVRKAGEEAERDWRAKEGAKGIRDLKELEGVRIDHDLLAGHTAWWDRFWRGDWTVQGISDYVVDQIVVVRV